MNSRASRASAPSLKSFPSRRHALRAAEIRQILPLTELPPGFLEELRQLRARIADVRRRADIIASHRSA